MIKEGLAQFRDTFRHIRQNRMVFLFLLSYWFYIDGVDSVIRMGVKYGGSLGFDKSNLAVAVLIIQFIGFPAAIAYGYLGNRIGAKRGILIAIFVLSPLANMLKPILPFDCRHHFRVLNFLIDAIIMPKDSRACAGNHILHDWQNADPAWCLRRNRILIPAEMVRLRFKLYRKPAIWKVSTGAAAMEGLSAVNRKRSIFSGKRQICNDAAVLRRP